MATNISIPKFNLRELANKIKQLGSAAFGNIGVDVQAYDATILKDADIGVTVQSYDANAVKSTGSSTDNAVARYNGATGDIQNSAVIIDDSNHIIAHAGVTLGTSAGIYSAANTLDDYEEGTWTPVLGGTTTSGQTYGTQAGWYIKVGNLVAASFFCNLTSVGTVTGSAYISNLPFVSQNISANYRGHISAVSYDALASSFNQISATVLNNVNYAFLITNTTESNSMATTAANAVWANGCGFQGTIFYRVA